ncbi:hypothetical protein [Dactylosporangium sp. NPDC051541]|uniref:hypothetical protein n=1 Tax=Dactylosporangium sp. NPDC051541 TaxID=3363977 RepID=UPI0037BBC373
MVDVSGEWISKPADFDVAKAEEAGRRAEAWFESLNAIDALRADLVRDRPDLRPTEISYCIANIVIQKFLGDAWWGEHLAGGTTGQAIYLRSHRSYRGAPGEHVQRVVSLGRRVFEFQDMPWFGDLVANLQRRDLHGAVFEAEVLHMLTSIPLEFRLRAPVGEKGRDYDIGVDLGGTEWAIEVKSRADDSDYRAGALMKTLEGARRQLPGDGIGTTFVRVPYAWTKSGLYRRQSADEITDHLRQTSRVHAVVLVWDHWTETAFSGLHWQRRTRVFLDERADLRVTKFLRTYDRLWSGDVDLLSIAAPF